MLDEAERALVQRAVAGDSQAFADLYEANLDRVFRYFYYRLGDRHEAEDLTEQVFLKAWQSIKTYNDRGLPFFAWLSRIAHNLLIDHRRVRREAVSIDEAIDVRDGSNGPEEEASRKADAAELAEAISQLTDVEQSVLVLRFIEDLDHRTVAGIVNKSEVATRSIQSRALSRLARILTGRDRS